MKTTVPVFDIDKRNSIANLEIDLEAANHELEMLRDQQKDQPNNVLLANEIEGKVNTIAELQLKILDAGGVFK
jgi:hypothetical protein